MSALTDIQREISEADALVMRHERALSEQPDLRSIQLNLSTLRKKRNALEREFLAASSAIGMDVCSYRMFADNFQPTILAFSRVMEHFQEAVTVFYDVVKTNHPKQNTHASGWATAETALNIGYTFSGSIGVVLTIPNERLLGIESDLDEAISLMFKLARSDDCAPVIADFVSRFGAGPVRAAYRWADSHIRSGLGADIEWRRGMEIRDHLFVESIHFESLKSAMDTTGEETVEEITVRGYLNRADIRAQSFRIKVESGEEIRGHFEDAISDAHTIEIPKWYTAHLRKTSRVKLSQAEDEHEFFLLSLD